ncbi:calcium-binding protein, partial [bacterium]|nr:calcium-binding protein [bacterium]
IIAGDGANIITTGDGNDSIIAGDGGNNISSGIGQDYIETGSGNDTINSGSSGVKTIYSGAGYDSIVLNTTDESYIDMGAGNDTLNINASSGNHTIIGGAGNDEITDYSSANNIYEFNSGDGNDTITLYNAPNATFKFNDAKFDDLNWALSGDNREDLVVTYGDGTDSITIKNVDLTSEDYVFIDSTGTSKSLDVAIGGAVNPLVINGKASVADTINGSAWSDIITAGSAADVIYGNDGNDIIYGGRGSDKIYGGDGNDTIYGNSETDGKDSTSGTKDYISGGAGNDVIYSQSAYTEIEDEEGNDTYYAYLDQFTQITDSAGSDTLNIIETQENTNIFFNFEWDDERKLIDTLSDTNMYIRKNITNAEQGITIVDYTNDGTIETIKTSDGKTLGTIDMTALRQNITEWLNAYYIGTGNSNSVMELLSSSEDQTYKNTLIQAFNNSYNWS